MIFSKNKCQGCEFKVAKEVTRYRIEVPRIKHGHGHAKPAGTTVPHKTGRTSRPAMWHGLAMPYGTTMPPGQCQLVRPCHVARPCLLLCLCNLNFPRVCFRGYSFFFSQTSFKAIFRFSFKFFFCFSSLVLNSLL